ncbi:unknown [Crocosphaera subtropica ATCC 51142]|uniref:UspA domain-containing protein n=1 Tax=Crocosphaera subtropica (strain ATCC 51142 / BH68) TaxID=43989 RepID=B1X1M3_CROS5|nr:universal stress protein [Crocosphaera subtropica]ACB53053.1 unknown [Crocosphaera subtropica ATCC 51142]
MTHRVKSREVLDPVAVKSETVTCEYGKILVAIEEGDNSKEVFDTALQLAKAQGSQLMILTVIQESFGGTMDLPIYSEMTGYGAIYNQEMIELEEKLIQESLEELQIWLKRLTQKAINQGVKAESDYTYGEPGKQICTLAKTWEADLIVVGRRGRRGISELLLGSVSNYVVHHAPCSILVVQH